MMYALLTIALVIGGIWFVLPLDGTYSPIWFEDTKDASKYKTRHH